MASKSDQPPADERVYDVGSFEAELFWQKNRSAILIGAALVLAVAAAIVIWLLSQHSARRAAEALFAEAEELRRVARTDREVSGLGPAANAYFLLADSLRSQGKLDESSALLRDISLDVSGPSSGWRRAPWNCGEPRRGRENE